MSKVFVSAKKIKISYLDLIWAPAGAAIIGFLGIFYVGGPISWDELWYMEVSLNPTKYPEIMNRYFHIYFQKLFFWLARDALLGAKIYWCFLLSATFLLVFYCSKMLSRRSSVTIGLISVLLLSTQDLIFRFAGVTYVEFTVMMLLTLGINVYLLYVYSNNKHDYLLLIALGLILFLIIKSKETGIVLAVLFLGLGMKNNHERRIENVAKDLGSVLVGILLGAILFILLNYLYLNDPWFGFRLSELRSLSTFNIGEFPRHLTKKSSYAYIANTTLLFPFLLYLISIWKHPNTKLSYQEKITWLIPLAFLLFLTTWFIGGRGRFIFRHIIPIIPVICIWASQFFVDVCEVLACKRESIGSFDSYVNRKFEFATRNIRAILHLLFPRQKGLNKIPLRKEISENPMYEASMRADKFNFSSFNRIAYFFGRLWHYSRNLELFPLIAALSVSIVLQLAIFYYARALGWKGSQFYVVIILPLGISALLILPVAVRKQNSKSIFLTFLLFFFVVLRPIGSNLSSLANKTIAQKYETRFYPLETFFSKDTAFSKDAKIFISENIYREHKILSRSRVSSMWMFNIYFNQNLSKRQFVFTDNILDIEKGNYDYIFLSNKDWEKLSQTPAGQQLKTKYLIKSDKKKYVTFLMRNN